MASPRRTGGSASLLRAAIEYVETALRSVEGMKALLVDADLRVVLNLVSTHTALLQHEVVFVDVLETADRPDLSYLPCVVLARPVADSVRAVSHELEVGRFREFHLAFTNTVDADVLQALCNADGRKLVKTFQELYLDFMPIADDTALIRLGTGQSAATAKLPLSINEWTNADFTRVSQGLVATMLATNRRPLIRFRNNNKVTARIAAEVGARMRMVNTTFFDLRARASVLLILDRSDDPVTPLLTQWTYEAMVHEHFAIRDGIVDLDDSSGGDHARLNAANATPNAEHDKQVLSPQHDNFFAAHRESDWGELCTSVKDLIEAYKALHHIDLATASLKDIKEFMGRFPDAKLQSTIMTRHATIVGKLGDIVMGRALVDVSTVEQELACGPAAPNDHARLVMDCIKREADPDDAARPSAPAPDANGTHFAHELNDVVKLVMLYELRYENSGKATTEAHCAEMRAALRTVRSAGASHLALMDRYMRFASAAHRVLPLYPKSPGMLKGMVKAISGFGGEVQNVLTQHTPVLKRIVAHLCNGTLPEEQFPFQAAANSAVPADETARCSDIIVFMAGGATYEESLLVSRLNGGDVDNDPTTFPPGAEIAQPAPGTAAAVAAAAAGQASEATGKRMLSGLARLTGHASDTAEAPAGEAGGPAPVSKKLNCHVRLVANGMLRSGEFMMALP